MDYPMVDPEVHIGRDLFGLGKNTEVNSDIRVFKEKMTELKVVKAFLISAPSYELKIGRSIVERSCIWRIKPNGEVSYIKETISDQRLTKEINPTQPYINANLAVLRIVKKENRKSGKKRFYFVPIFHPKLDKPENIERFLNDENTSAVKIHGIATYCSYKDVPEWAIRLFKKYDIPLLLHTDYLRRKKSGILTSIQKLQLANSALLWSKWILKNNIRAYLAHGASVDPSVAKLVNKEDDLIVGTGPDCLLEKRRKTSLNEESIHYLEGLLENFIPEKIAYSSDYPWNIDLQNKSKYLDWHSKERIVKTCLEHNFNKKDIERILSMNSIRFFDL